MASTPTRDLQDEFLAAYAQEPGDRGSRDQDLG